MLYKGEATNEIIFPLGGIGTGCVGFAGNGRLIDWELFNRPAKGSDNGYSHLALRAESEDGVQVRVLNGDLMKEYTGHYKGGEYYAGYGFGPAITTMAGFAHFSDWSFEGSFPVAKLSLREPGFPAEAEVTAFNPMIPNDTEDSSIPGAFFEITIRNTTDKPVTYTAAFSLCNPFPVSRNTLLPEGNGVFLKNAGADSADPEYGDMTLTAEGGEVACVADWYRGGWQDGIATYWREITSPEGLRPRCYGTDGARDVCTVTVKKTLKAGENAKVRYLMTWNVPNCRNYWDPIKDENGKDVTWKNWYATKWADSRASNDYAMSKWEELWERTRLFRDALMASDADPAVLDAASSCLSVLHSPTVLRLEDGSLYGWEGCHEKAGSCEGTCEHVWNYAYALCYLFPDLERSLRELDYKYNLQPSGAMRFRMTLPVGRPGGWEMPCLDGQMGGVIKTYRDWKLCGDGEWLRKLWPDVKKTLEFAWSEKNKLGWDENKDGVLEGRQHHTLDMELFGPSSWLEGLYLAALKAGAEMAEYLGEADSAAEYRELFQKGSKWTEENLFNGRWYFQKVDLNDISPLDKYGDAVSTLQKTGIRDTYWNPETGELKYQIGEGSEIDQILGQWHAHLCGLGDIFDPQNRKKALESMAKYNFKPTFRGFTNPWRNFILNDEAGAIICDYPEGAYKPSIPIPYCEETMHGFEYQMAGLLLREGYTEEGLRVVKGVRDRYDGKKRNPWNEIECGNNYARSMAAFALLPLLSGFRADLPHKTVTFDPAKREEMLNTFWSLDGAWGSAELSREKTVLRILEGTLRANRLELPYMENVSGVTVDGTPVGFTFQNGVVTVDADALRGTVEIVG